MTTYPEHVDLSIDCCCNFRCVMCRDESTIDDGISSENMEKIIDSKLIPLLRNCKMLTLNGGGEFFVSNMSKNLVKKAAVLYPKMEYTILTNGFLCTPKALRDLGILDQRTTISLSLHTLNEETHYKITRVPNAFPTIMNNIMTMRECLDKDYIRFMMLNFVISSYNYHEIREMAHFCVDNEIVGHFWEFRNWGYSAMCKNYDEHNVTDKNHPCYEHLKELMQDKAFDHPKYVILNGILENIRNEK